MTVQPSILPVPVHREIANFYSDCVTMEQADYNLVELVGHMAKGPIVWNEDREVILAKDDNGRSNGGPDIAIMNDALEAFYYRAVEPNIRRIEGPIHKIILNEDRGVMGILYG